LVRRVWWYTVVYGVVCFNSNPYLELGEVVQAVVHTLGQLWEQGIRHQKLVDGEVAEKRQGDVDIVACLESTSNEGEKKEKRDVR
jgi:hypothetical protein